MTNIIPNQNAGEALIKAMTVRPNVTGATVKKFLKSLGHSTVRVRTVPGKSQWIHAWIPSDRGNPMVLSYSQPPFSFELRRECLRTVYGDATADNLAVTQRPSHGNIATYSISMVASQWAALIENSNLTPA